MTVTLRQRKKGDKISLYLDYYSDGKRDYEYLQLYLIPEPEKGKLTKEQKEENRKTMVLAEAIRSKRLLQIKNEEYGFRDTDKAKGSFIAYFERLTEKRRNSQGNWGNWDEALRLMEGSGRKPEDYLGKWVCVTGMLTAYRRRPQIIVNKPFDIEILDETRVKARIEDSGTIRYFPNTQKVSNALPVQKKSTAKSKPTPVITVEQNKDASLPLIFENTGCVLIDGLEACGTDSICLV